MQVATLQQSMESFGADGALRQAPPGEESADDCASFVSFLEAVVKLPTLHPDAVYGTTNPPPYIPVSSTVWKSATEFISLLAEYSCYDDARCIPWFVQMLSHAAIADMRDKLTAVVSCLKLEEHYQLYLGTHMPHKSTTLDAPKMLLEPVSKRVSAAVLVETMPHEVFFAATVPSLERTRYISASGVGLPPNGEWVGVHDIYLFGTYLSPDEVERLADTGARLFHVVWKKADATERYKGAADGANTVLEYQQLADVVGGVLRLVVRRNRGTPAENEEVEHFLKGFYDEFSGGDRVFFVRNLFRFNTSSADYSTDVQERWVKAGAAIARRDAATVRNRLRSSSAVRFALHGHSVLAVVGVTELINETKVTAAETEEIGAVLSFQLKDGKGGWAVKLFSRRVDVLTIAKMYGGGGSAKDGAWDAGFFVENLEARKLLPFLY